MRDNIYIIFDKDIFFIVEVFYWDLYWFLFFLMIENDYFENVNIFRLD